MPFESTDLLLASGMFLAALLYSSVGHAGASAYLALMALFGVQQAVMRPTALVLNIIVASLVSVRFVWAKVFRWRVLWPFLIGAAPFALLGGSLHLPGNFYKPLVGLVLLAAAARLLWPIGSAARTEIRDPPIFPAILGGAGIGFLSGLTGTGGGIFLSPLILFLGWAETRTISGVAAVFVLCNSVAGLFGNLASVGSLPSQLPLYAAAVIAGAALGSTMGISRLPKGMILKALGLVLVVAGLKLVFFS